MTLVEAFPKLSRNDGRLIRRDPFLIFMSVYVLVMAVVVRFFIPWLSELLLAQLGFDLTPYYPLIVSLLAIWPQFTGIVFGFLLLDERDQHTLSAMLVTPLPLDTFLLYRMAASALLAFVMGVITLLIVGISEMNLGQMLLVSAAGSLFSPAVMLFIAAFAADKVEGFALTKIYGLVGMLPLLAYFVPEPWQFLFGFFPPYWVCKAVWSIAEGEALWPLYLVLGSVTALAYLWRLTRRFDVIAHR